MVKKFGNLFSNLITCLEYLTSNIAVAPLYICRGPACAQQARNTRGRWKASGRLKYWTPVEENMKLS
jgi:hypothetical protein